jgi:hypothetical protein
MGTTVFETAVSPERAAEIDAGTQLLPGLVGRPNSTAAMIGKLRGIEKHTYWIMPLHLLAQAGWYKMFGFSLLTNRTLSTAWGLALLGAIFIVVKLLSGKSSIALLTLALLSVDSVYISMSAFGRMEMMCVALGFWSMASYLMLREKHFHLAILISQAFMTAVGLTHPNGIFLFFALQALILFYDAGRIRFKELAIAAVPYLVGMGLWSFYILEDPQSAFIQLSGNGAGRWAGLTHPFAAIRTEFEMRYLPLFGFSDVAGAASRLKVLNLAAYMAAFFGGIFSPRFRAKKGYQAILMLTGIMVMALTFLESLKFHYYFIYVVPFYTALVAIWAHDFWHRKTIPRWAIAGAVCCLAAVQLIVVVNRIRKNPYRTAYEPVISYLKANGNQNKSILGVAELGYGLGYEGAFKDDLVLGYYSGKKPDYIVAMDNYEDIIRGLVKEEPGVNTFILNRLTNEYRRVLTTSAYVVYAAR